MHTALCDELGIDVPIFAFTHCRDVVVAVSKAGGFGVLLANSYDHVDYMEQWRSSIQAAGWAVRPRTGCRVVDLEHLLREGFPGDFCCRQCQRPQSGLRRSNVSQTRVVPLVIMAQLISSPDGDQQMAVMRS